MDSAATSYQCCHCFTQGGPVSVASYLTFTQEFPFAEIIIIINVEVICIFFFTFSLVAAFWVSIALLFSELMKIVPIYIF